MSEAEADEDLEQQTAKPADETAEVVGGSSEDSIDGVALPVPEVIATHPMFGFEVTDHGLDGGTSAQLALDGRGHPPLLA